MSLVSKVTMRSPRAVALERVHAPGALERVHAPGAGRTLVLVRNVEEPEVLLALAPPFGEILKLEYVELRAGPLARREVQCRLDERALVLGRRLGAARARPSRLEHAQR